MLPYDVAAKGSPVRALVTLPEQSARPTEAYRHPTAADVSVDPCD